jgi:tellurite resistance protein TerC
MNTFLSHIPSFAELVSAFPVILSLIMIEGLLSVDNAMAIAAMASHLPPATQKKALRFGIIGAYLARGVCLLIAGWIASNHWVKAFGAVYLLYLMGQHLVNPADEDHDGTPDVMQKGFLATVISIEIMDLTLSLDNVVAAVALDKRLWVVVTGVFIGILALRFVAGACIKLIQKFPILEKTAFLLVGFVGAILVAELSIEYFGGHFHINSFHKFAGILTITVLSLLYGHTVAGRALIQPVVTVGTPFIKALNKVLSIVMWPVITVVAGIKGAWNWLMKPSNSLGATAL